MYFVNQKKVYAFMLPYHHITIRLLKKMGVTIEQTQDATKATLNLKEQKMLLLFYGLAFLCQRLKSVFEDF